MKMLPVQLSLNPPLGLWSDVLWRCPPAAPSQLAELKTQLPASLPSDPRLWSREDVTVFLRFCEREFDLPKLDYELFQMNGKALCLLTRADFGHRCPGAGDVLHNVLQMLIIESYMMQWHLPNSPVTPTSRYPLSPHSHPPTPTWPPIAPPDGNFQSSHMHHFMAPNSVTLSPPPSVDSQASSPPQNSEQLSANGNAIISTVNSSSSSSSNSSASSSSVTTAVGAANIFIPLKRTSTSSSNHSDSDDESITDNCNANKNALSSSSMSYNSSPPTTPILKEISQSLTQQMTNTFVSTWNQAQSQAHIQKLQLPSGSGGSASAPTTPSFMQPVKREFFPENSEPNTNGRLLWDFLQQLLNDRNQKYSDLIAWKCRDTGVFKIVDPAGLAKLWGIQKNHLSMNYDKMSRALRYYYRVNILRKVQGERHCYQFLRNPTELKNIKNISLLRQSVSSSTNASNNSSNSNSYQQGVSISPQSSNSNSSTLLGCSSSSSTNKTLQTGNWHGSSATSGSGHTNIVSPLSPQRPASRNSGTHPMNLPTVAAVAAAAAAAYGPPPSSPLFMHAINGAFHYLSSNSSAVTPNSPILTSTSDEKFHFHPLKSENGTNSLSHENSEDMKPTDLSIGGSAYSNNNTEKRSYNDDCYPLIRNGDGLTTIKLIRYNENSDGFKSALMQQQNNDQQQHEVSPKVSHTENVSQSTKMAMETNADNEGESKAAYENIIPTDLRK